MLSFLLYPPVFVNSTKLNSCLYEESTHQGEKLYGRLLPSVLRVSEKNSSRKLGFRYSGFSETALYPV